MSSLPKEPRQQMINMMYLFLTAMLALNVSAEILRAFMIVNQSLERTVITIDDKNEIIMQQFEKKMQEDPDKTGPFKSKADLVVRYSGDLVSLIIGLKSEMIDQGGNNDGKADSSDYKMQSGDLRLRGEDNLHVATWWLIGDKGGKRGKNLQSEINKTRERFLETIRSTLSESEFKNFSANLSLNEALDKKGRGDKPGASWTRSHFGEVPLAAAVTLMSKFTADVKNAEAEILQHLLESISATDFKFDVLTPVIIPTSKYVMQGGNYEAEIFVAASSSTTNPQVIVGGVDSMGNIINPDDTISLPVVGGRGKLIIEATGTGAQEYAGVILLRNPGGEGFQRFPFKAEWNVMVGQAVVSPTKMNVLYIGVDNPLAISAAGFTSDRIKPSISGGGGSLRPDRKGGEYLAKVRAPGKTIVSVNVIMNDGTSKKVGAQEFRVKRVPDPIATLGKQYVSGKIKAGALKVQRGIVADLKDFVFDLRFNVVSFEMTFRKKGEDLVKAKTKGPRFSDKMIKMLKRAKKEDAVFFDEIKVRGPDGLTRKLPGLAFQVM